MKKYKMIRADYETHKKLKQMALDEETSIRELLNKILKSYYKIK